MASTLKINFNKTALEVINSNQAVDAALHGELMRRVNEESWLWAKVAKLFCGLKAKAMDIDRVITSHNDETNLGRLHLIQANKEKLTLDNVSYNFGNIEKVIVFRSLMHCDEMEVPIAEAFNVIAKLKNGDMRETFHNV